ncbi:hypothetical protein [uncultured Bartonella sp.]|nr:hypothetical protein [uncultured Bartonella sp.]
MVTTPEIGTRVIMILSSRLRPSRNGPLEIYNSQTFFANLAVD